jgi:acyl-homoserine-lactone acylase
MPQRPTRPARLALFAALTLTTTAAPITRAAAQQIVSQAPSEVTVVRDDWGVPHVFAAREADGYYGLGYAMAEDRLESVLRRWLAASGRLASVFGPDSLSKDLARLEWRHLEAARAGLARTSPQLRADYAMLVAGVRRYMDDHPERVPPWARDLALEPAMPVAWSRAWTFYWAEGVDECKAGGAPVEPHLLAALTADGRAMPASNAWTVSPWRTAEGVAMLVGDSHSEFTGNGEMWEFRLHAGDLDVAGTSGVGTGWVIVGHTRRLAWTTTNRSYDGADCYRVVVDRANPRRYRYDGRWRTITTRTVVVPVKGGPSATRVFEYTDHNGVPSPVVARRGDTAWVASDPYADRAAMIDAQMHRQLTARSIADLREAQHVQDLWPTNLVAADADGNTYYLRAGRVPIRRTGLDWALPLDGNTSATAWDGVHALADLVQIENPASGYLQSNNVSPDVMFEGSRLTADHYAPEVYGERAGSDNFRGRRSRALLSRMFAATTDDMLALLFDEKWEGADAFVSGLAGALARNAADVAVQSPGYRRFADRLARFDGYAAQRSMAALSYLYWRRALAEHAESNRELVRLTRQDSVPGPGLHSALLAAVPRAMQLLEQDFGTTELTFGDVFRVGRGGVSHPLGGFVGTMRAMVYGTPDSAGRQWVRSGQRQPLVVAFTTPVTSYTSLNFGESNDPASPHFADQSRLMSERRLKPSYFDEAALTGHVESRRTLTVPWRPRGRMRPER